MYNSISVNSLALDAIDLVRTLHNAIWFARTDATDINTDVTFALGCFN